MKFSIITVCYNSEKTIKRTLESLLNQTYKDFEVIIVDGLSSDRTLEIVREYSLKINNITIISEKDNGIYDAMNKGVKISKGELIAFLNSDDFYENDALEKIAEFYTSDIDIIYGDTYHIDNYNNIYYEKIIDKVDIKDILNGKMIPHTSTFVRKDICLEKWFDEKYKIAADYKFILTMYLKGKKFKYIDYRINNMALGGVSTTQSYKMKEEYNNIIEEFKYLNIKKKKNSKIKNEIMNLKIKLIRLLPKSVYIKYKYIKKGWKKYDNKKLYL